MSGRRHRVYFLFVKSSGLLWAAVVLLPRWMVIGRFPSVDQLVDRSWRPDGEGHPVLDPSIGLLVVSLISTHLGCRVSFCSTSTWFDDPCHGSRWNAWREWVGGPAPRGLDRIGSHVNDDGMLVVDLTRHITGPPRDNGILEQNAAGPSCVDQ